MIDFFLIGLIIIIGWQWSSALKAREQAFASVKIHCKKLNLQLLDEYVALNGFWMKRDTHGKYQAWRSYLFEFSSTGFERYNGKIILLGDKILSIQLEPYREEL